MVSPWLLIPVALVPALAWWPLRTCSRRTLWIGTTLLVLTLGALPWMADRTSLAGLGALVLIAAAALPAKLIDSAVAPEVWRTRRWREWAFFMSLPFVVCFRGHLQDPVRPAARMILRGLLEVSAGSAILWWAFHWDWRATSILVEHVVKLSGLYLVVLDGGFVLATGLLRFVGFPIQDLSRDPIAATTPADFWRRYNADAGRFFRENLFRRVPSRSAAVRTLVVFIVNGLLHEYLAWVMCGRILGYPLAFFTIQGIAVVLTARRRPSGPLAHVSRAATMLFMAACFVLIAASINAFASGYFSPRQ